MSKNRLRRKHIVDQFDEHSGHTFGDLGIEPFLLADEALVEESRGSRLASPCEISRDAAAAYFSSLYTQMAVVCFLVTEEGTLVN